MVAFAYIYICSVSYRFLLGKVEFLLGMYFPLERNAKRRIIVFYRLEIVHNTIYIIYNTECCLY